MHSCILVQEAYPQSFWLFCIKTSQVGTACTGEQQRSVDNIREKNIAAIMDGAAECHCVEGLMKEKSSWKPSAGLGFCFSATLFISTSLFHHLQPTWQRCNLVYLFPITSCKHCEYVFSMCKNSIFVHFMQRFSSFLQFSTLRSFDCVLQRCLLLRRRPVNGGLLRFSHKVRCFCLNTVNYCRPHEVLISSF